MARHKIILSYAKLDYLYWDKKLSTDEIGKIFSCNHVTILNRLKEFNIKRRTKLGNRRSVIITAQTLKKLYIDNKFSENQIAQKLSCSRHTVEVRMKFYGIKPRSYSESNTKYPKNNFGGDPIEKSYLIGFRLGDLNVYKKDNLFIVRCSSTVQAQVDLIKQLFSPYTFVYTKPSRILKGSLVIDIRCHLNDSFKFLLPKQDMIENWILSDENLFFSFFAGYIDAEGHIYTRLQYKTPFSGIEIQSYDKNILFQTWYKLNDLQIECPRPLLNKEAGYTDKRGLTNKKDCWRLAISKKKSLNLLFKSINPYLKHEKRRKDMEKAWKNVLERI